MYGVDFESVVKVTCLILYHPFRKLRLGRRKKNNNLFEQKIIIFYLFYLFFFNIRNDISY